MPRNLGGMNPISSFPTEKWAQIGIGAWKTLRSKAALKRWPSACLGPEPPDHDMASKEMSRRSSQQPNGHVE